MVKSYVTRSEYYLTHKGYHVGFMQYDGTTKEIKLCMLRIPLGVPMFVVGKVVEISRVSRVNVLPKMAELLEHYGIEYE